MRRGIHGRAALVAALTLTLATPAAACATTARPALQRAAVLRLLNRIRAAHRLAPLRVSGALTLAATAHSRAMREGRYFAHVGRDGRGPAQRIAASGYLRGRRRWAIGEALAYGTGSLATPVALVATLMRSPPHRALLLSRSYRDVGIGLATGAPVGAAPAATLTLDFGRR